MLEYAGLLKIPVERCDMNKQSSGKKFFIGIVLLLVCVGSVFGFRYTKQVQKNKNAALSVSSGKVRGPDSAPIRIIDFSDFECPACRMAATLIEALMQKYPGKIQLIFKHFPLRMHVWSPVAHQAAECASSQGKFWEFYRKVYENQPIWATTPDPMVSFATYAQDVGLNMDTFAQCMADPTVAENIAAEKKEGEALEVKSTPTFFVNGKMFAGGTELLIGGQDLIRKTLGLPPEPHPDIAPGAKAPLTVAPAAAVSASAGQAQTSAQPAPEAKPA